LQQFERNFQVKVRYRAYGSNQEMLDRLQRAEFPWDLAFPCQQFLPRMRRQNLITDLDRSLLPNLANLSPEFRNPFWDVELKDSVPCSWGLTGIAFSRQLQLEIRRWADLWDERLRERLTMLDDRDEVLGAALLKLGYPVNSADPRHMAAASAEAIRQKRLVRSYGITESKDRLVSGEFQVAQLWSNLAGQAMAASPNLEFVFPEEGFPMYAENAVVLRSSAEPELAHAFINFLLTPEIAARISANAYTPSTVPESRRFLPLRLRENPLLFPAEDVLKRGQWLVAQPDDALVLRRAAWQRIQAA
ncbi:MAG: spermidine/putrescine ABC transporter substrate-binding protein, partial [Bryobacterales bacterium]|nr:spermidine/putrescine ABC transporter substrate-binding protein [Bryobacterales bacterium]